MNPSGLTEEEKMRFHEVYCGVCRCLKDECGHKARFALSFDCTFLALLLNALYEPDEVIKDAGCAAHPFKRQMCSVSEMTRYAADINMLLLYMSALDGWMDDRSGAKLALSKIFKQNAEKVMKRYPEKAKAVTGELQALHRLEQLNTDDPDAACSCFGRLLGEVFAYKSDEWAPVLRSMGVALGRFIYLMDAWDDLDRDIKKRAYNPFAAIRNEEDYEKRVYDILTMEMAECVAEFEKLPIVKDAHILRNILYSGVWMKYTAKQERSKRKGKDV